MILIYKKFKIDIPYEAIHVKDIEIKQCINEHGHLKLKLLIEEGKVSEYINKNMAEEKVVVEVEREDGKSPLFVGKVSEVHMSYESGLHIMEIKCISYTKSFDIKKNSRTFCNLGMTYKDVIGKVLESYPKASFKDEVTQGALIEDFLLQYEETDWEFLKRLASHFNAVLLSECTKDYGRFYFGLPMINKGEKIDLEEYEVAKDIDTYNKREALNLKENFLQEYVTWDIEGPKDFALGEQVVLNNVKCRVAKIHTEVYKEEIKEIYTMVIERGVRTLSKVNHKIFGMSIPATIKEVKGNSVKVHFQIDPVYKEFSKQKYFTYAIESSSWYCMPEKESKVHIYFPTNDEKEAIAINSIRSNGKDAQYASKTQDPNIKSFSNPSGSEMKLTPSDMNFAADDSGSVALNLSKSGDISLTGENINFTATENLELGMRNADGDTPPFRPETIEISAKSKIEMSKGGTLGLQITNETYLQGPSIKSDGTIKDAVELPPGIANRDKDDEALINQINAQAKAETEQKIQEAKSKMGFGLIAAAIGAVAVVVAVGVLTAATVATGGLALVAVAGLVGGIVAVGVGVSEMAEGSSNYSKAQSGNFQKSYNFMRDSVCRGNETLYNVVKYGSVMVSAVAITILSGGTTAGVMKKLSQKLVMDMGGDVLINAIMDYAQDGKINNSFTSYADSMIVSGGLSCLSMGAMNKISKIEDTAKLVKTAKEAEEACKRLGKIRLGLDIGLDVAGELATTGDVNLTATFIKKYVGNKVCFSDPVDGATGSLYIPATDIVLPDIHEEFKIERKYESVNSRVGSLGMGWTTNFESCLYAVGDSVNVLCVDGHVETFNEIDGVFVNDKGGATIYTLKSEKDLWIFKSFVDKKIYRYNSLGKLISITDKYTNELSLTYLGDHIDTLTTFSNYKLFFTYKEGKVIQIKDELNRTVQYKYAGDYLTDVVHVDHGITRYTYNEEGYVNSITDQNGQTYTKNFFDIKGRVTRQDFPKGDTCNITYDDAEREVTFHYLQSQRIEKTRFNKDGLITHLFYEDGTTEEYKYDNYQNKSYIKDRKGFETRKGYNAFGSLLEETLPNGLIKRYAYDEEQNLIKESDNEGKEVIYTYNSLGNLIEEKTKISVGEWKEESYTYDSYGRILTKTDGNKNTSKYEYDLGSFLQGKQGKDPVTVTTNSNYVYRYEYDEVGRNTSIETDYGTIEFGYNNLNYVSEVKDGNGNITRKSYDKMGNLIRVDTPNGGNYSYKYDHMDRLLAIKNPLGFIEKNIRDSEGNIIKEINPNYYDPETQNGLGVEYVYDKDNRKIKTIYPDGGVERFFLDSNGNVIKHISPEYYNAETDDGLGYSYNYDAMNRLAAIINEEGITEKTFEYDLHGNIVKEIDNEGNTTLFKYDLLGNLIEKRVPVEKVTVEGLEDNKEISRKKNATNASKQQEIKYNLTCYQYDKNSNKTLEKHGTTLVYENEYCNYYHEIHFEYDKENRLIEVKDKYGAKARYKYDSLNNKTYESFKINDTTEKIIHYNYDKAGNLIEKKEEIDGKFISPESKAKNIWAITKYEYDKNGNATKIITPKGFEIGRIYDAIDRVIEQYEKDDLNNIFRSHVYKYDKASNIIALSEYSGKDAKLINKKYSSENDYNLNVLQRLEKKKENEKLFKELKFEEDKKSKGYTYDAQNRLTHFTNVSGNTTRLFYDKNDRIIKQILPEQYDKTKDEGLGTTYVYNLKGQVIEVKNALAETVTKNTYDPKGNMKTSIDGENNKVEYTYTLLGQIKDIVTPNSRKENKVAQSYKYDARGNITGITDGNGNDTSYTLDDWGRITQIITPEGGTEKYTYDYAGNIVSTTDANGGTITYSYNSLGQVCEIKDQEGNSEYFYYDEEGNLSKQLDRNKNIVDRVYNIDKNIVSVKAYKSDEKTIEEISKEQKLLNIIEQRFNYNEDGTLKNAYTGNMQYEYSFNAEGMLESKSASGRTLLSYAYDKNNNIKTIKDITGKSSVYSYDAANRVKIIKDNNEDTLVNYDYFKNGNIKTINYGNGLKTDYSYDGDGNVESLVTITSTGEVLVDYNYAYDLNGNRLEKVSSKHKNHYTYDSMNRLKDSSYDGGQESFTYDKVGNRLTKTTNTITDRYVYNVKNQLKELHQSSGINHFTYDKQGNTIKEESNIGVNSFEYNTLNQQVRAITKDGNTLVSRYDTEGLRFEVEENEKLTRFIFHKENVLVEADKDYNPISRFVRGYEVVAADIATGELKSEENRYYYTQDEQGSTIYITDKGQQIKNEYCYDAFGNVLDSREDVHNRITYTGQQFDGITQQYYLRARFYNPVIGRFTQEDVYRGDGLNLYGYCGNNPVVYYDPSGYMNCDTKKNAWNDYLNKHKGEGKDIAQLKDEYYKSKGVDPSTVKTSNKTPTDKLRSLWEEYTGKKSSNEIHHGLPEEFKKWFGDKKIDVNSGEYFFDLPEDVHRLKEGNGIHTNNSPLGKDWNTIWYEWIENNRTATNEQILAKLNKMAKKAGIDKYRAVPKK